MRALAALILTASASTALAEGTADDRIGLVVHGTPGLRGRLEEHVGKTLRREGFTAVDAALSRDALNTITNCFILEDLACARGVVEARARTPRLLYVRVEQTGDVVTVDLTWFSAGSAPVAAKATCESCADTFMTEADGALRHLAATAPAPVVTESPPEAAQPTAPPSRVLPMSMMIGGGVTVVAGGISLYYGLRDDPSQKYIYPTLTPVGIALLAVGAGAAIGGFILLKPAGSAHSQPVAAVSGGSAYLGWAGTF